MVVTGAAVAAAVTGLARRTPDSASAADLPADWQRRFNVIGAVQAGAVALTVAVALAAGAAVLIPASVCLVVGLHLLPVGRLLRLRYRATGVALCATVAAGYVVPFTAGADEAVIAVGTGAALTLWSAAFRHATAGLSAGASHLRAQRRP